MSWIWSEIVISRFFLPVFVVDAMYKIPNATAKAAKTESKAYSVGIPSSHSSIPYPDPEAAMFKSVEIEVALEF